MNEKSQETQDKFLCFTQDQFAQELERCKERENLKTTELELVSEYLDAESVT